MLFSAARTTEPVVHANRSIRPNGVDPQMRRRHRLTAIVALTAALAVAPAIAYAATTISMSGATASFPLMELLAAKYRAVKKGKVTFKLSQGGATVGIQDAAAGKVSIGNSSRAPASTDPGGLTFYPIAQYFVCVVTNPANPISNLTADQVQQIFTGKVRDWSQVSGAKATGPIDVYSRTSVAGVLTTFQNSLLAGAKVSSVATQQASEGLMQNSVKKDADGIGFLSDYFALAKGINPVGYNGTACSVSNVVSGAYPGSSYFYEVTRGPAKGASADFIHWVQTSKPAKKIIETNWIPLAKVLPPVNG
jgi:phosphate transport system substrate-binding protein